MAQAQVRFRVDILLRLSRDTGRSMEGMDRNGEGELEIDYPVAACFLAARLRLAQNFFMRSETAFR